MDKFKAATTQEADPISLSIERTKSYFSNRKIYICSTPTLKTGHIWKAKEACDIEKHFFVPCPHCGKYIELKFAQIRWPGKDEGLSEGDRAEAAQYICQECNGVITDHDKPAMLLKGEWRNVRQSARTARSVAFWFNTLYSPFTRFSEIAREFMKSKDDPDKLHNFANSWLAEPWEDTKLKTSADLVQERQTEYTMKPVYVPRTPREKAEQRALLQYFRPENRRKVLDALRAAGRTDLIGTGPDCLVPPEPRTSRPADKPGKGKNSRTAASRGARQPKSRGGKK